MPKVILDAGHGGSDIGEYYERRSEKNDNLLLALRVGQFLMDRGVDVAYTRTADVYLLMLERVSMVHQSGADLLVSIHRLSGNTYNSTPGLDFFIKEDDEVGVQLANSIGQSLNSSGYENYGLIVRTDIPLINDTNIPAIMIGIGYIRSRTDNTNYDDNFVPIAKGIAEGIFKILQSIETGVGASEYPFFRYRYSVGIGPYHNYNHAFDNQLILCSIGCNTELAKTGDGYYIYTMSYEELDEAVVIELMLRKCGFLSFIVAT